MKAQTGADYPDAGDACRPQLDNHGNSVRAPGRPKPGLRPLGGQRAERAWGLSGAFAIRLVAWQRGQGRHDLPWQNQCDPYRVWLSEIMLQQTQVGTVIPYYLRFLERFPDVASLAAAPSEDVMALWAGLGYYARARNLHACARSVVEQHGGCFPDTAEALAALPGIGRSTAAAIAAFAFGRCGAILDGNVKRVLCRVFAIEGFPGQAAVDRTLWALADDLLPERDIEAYTQGLMDLGATLCTPKRPDCTRCPLADDCLARQQGRVDELPVARPKKALPQKQLGVLVVRCGDAVLLEHRPPAGIWGGLWSLPELREAEAPEAAVSRLLGLRADCRAGDPIRHSFTHFRLDIRPWSCVVKSLGNEVREPGRFVWARLAELDRYGLPTPIKALLNA